jgi:hypothetical protein
MLDLILFNLLIFTIVPMVSIRNSARGMRSGRYRAIRCVEIGDKIRSIVPHQRFLELNQFSFDDSLRYQNIEVGAWKQSNISTIQRQYIFTTSPISASLKTFEFVTLFGDDVSLTTTVSVSAFLFPRPPGAFIQSMKTSDIESLWKYHLEGEIFLLNEHGVKKLPVTNDNDIEYLMNEWIQRQGKYICKTPFFWLKAPYWCYVRRYRMEGVSVKMQLSR